MTTIVLPALARPFLEAQLPTDIDARWFTTGEEAQEMARDAEIGWLDSYNKAEIARSMQAGEQLKWVSTVHAGLDGFPLDMLRQRGTVFTNGGGVITLAVADYAVMGILAAAKGLPDVIRAQDRREWLKDSPGTVELQDSKALVIGYGAIGRAIGDRLRAFAVHVTGVRRAPDGEQDIIGPDDWRARLGEFDWIVLATPSTGETAAMIGAAEIAAMKREAWLVNIGRGALVNQPALVAALNDRRIAGAFLDVTTPEPLPADDPLWSAPNTIITMHLSGRAQTGVFKRSAALFLENLARYRAGQPLLNQVDLVLGY